MMAEVVTEEVRGAKWSIIPELVPPDVAYRAGQQALWLTSSSVDGPWKIRGETDPGTGMTTTIVRYDGPDPARNLPLYMMEQAVDLMEVVAQSEKRLGVYRPGLIINELPPDGLLPEHQDERELSVVATDLLEPGEVTIIDPLTGVVHTYRLLPGHSFELDNTGPREGRVEHAVRNLSSENTRVSVGV